MLKFNLHLGLEQDIKSIPQLKFNCQLGNLLLSSNQVAYLMLSSNLMTNQKGAPVRLASCLLLHRNLV